MQITRGGAYRAVQHWQFNDGQVGSRTHQYHAEEPFCYELKFYGTRLWCLISGLDKENCERRKLWEDFKPTLASKKHYLVIEAEQL